MLEAFIKSPGAAAIRAQYLKENFPAFTKDLSFGTVQAFQETILPKVDGSGCKGSGLCKSRRPCRRVRQSAERST